MLACICDRLWLGERHCVSGFYEVCAVGKLTGSSHKRHFFLSFWMQSLVAWFLGVVCRQVTGGIENFPTYGIQPCYEKHQSWTILRGLSFVYLSNSYGIFVMVRWIGCELARRDCYVRSRVLENNSGIGQCSVDIKLIVIFFWYLLYLFDQKQC